MAENISELKNKPSAKDIERILKERVQTVDHELSALKLFLISALVEYTIPETYSQLPLATKNLITQVFCSVVGIGNLVGKISQLFQVAQMHQSDSVHNYIDILEKVFVPNSIATIVGASSSSLLSSTLEIRELEKLVFKGKCFSVINEAATKFPDVVPGLPFGSMDQYLGYLSREILSLMKGLAPIKVSGFIKSVFSISSESVGGPFFSVMFTQDNWATYISTFQGMKSFEKKQQLKKLILSYIPQTFTLHDSNINCLVSILNHIPNVCSNLDNPYLEDVLSSGNKRLIILVSKLVGAGDQTKAFTTYVLTTFADPYLLKNETISKQQGRTLLLLGLLKSLDRPYLVELLKSRDFLDAISNRLGSFSNNVKSLGVVVADYVCELSGQEKIFNILDLEGYETMVEEVKASYSAFQLNDAWSQINVSVEEEDAEEIDENGIDDSKNTNDVAKPMQMLRLEDSDDESDDEDPSMVRKKRIATPLYIKDILNYINVDSEKDEHAYDKRRVALTAAPTLLRQKSSFGNEVALYAEDLLDNLLALTNHFDENDFDSLRLNAMIAVIVAYPKAAKHVVELLGTGDYSLQQRMCCLSSLSLSARNLKGFEDEVVVRAYNASASNFPSKKLPGVLHEKYLALLQQNQSRKQTQSSVTFGDEVVEKSLQDDLIDSVSKDFKEFTSVGKIIRKSTRLSKNVNMLDNKTPQRKDFPKLIGPDFFYPLIHLWYEIDGSIDIGHYSSIVTAHYLKTLTLILHCAYPNSLQLNDMINEFFILITPLTQKVNSDEIQLIESIVTAVLLICDISDDLFLVTNYLANLVVVQTWLSGSWEGIIDERVTSLCAGLLLRLNQLMDNYERLIMDQMNGIY